MMSRTQIVLDPELQRRARRKASELGISLAEYIRQLVSRDLKSPHRTVDRSIVFDLGDSGSSNIARDKDRMVGEAVAARHRRRRGPGGR